MYKCVRDEVSFENVDGLLESDDLTEYSRPSHHRCASHSLNIDNRCAEGGWICSCLQEGLRAVFGKCRSLWGKMGHSSLAAEAVEDVCGLMLLRPNQTWWNFVFLPVERVVWIRKEKGEDASTALSMQQAWLAKVSCCKVNVFFQRNTRR